MVDEALYQFIVYISVKEDLVLVFLVKVVVALNS